MAGFLKRIHKIFSRRKPKNSISYVTPPTLLSQAREEANSILSECTSHWDDNKTPNTEFINCRIAPAAEAKEVPATDMDFARQQTIEKWRRLGLLAGLEDINPEALRDMPLHIHQYLRFSERLRRKIPLDGGIEFNRLKPLKFY